MWGLKLKAIFTGLIIDVGATMVIGMQLGFLLVIDAQITYGAAHEARFQEIIQSTQFEAFSLSVGSCCTIGGSYVTAWMAQTDRIKNGLAEGILSAFFGLLFFANHTLWFNLAAPIATIGCAWLGSSIAQRRYGPPPVPQNGGRS